MLSFRILLLIGISSLLTACGKSPEETTQAKATTPPDTTIIPLALLPTLDCLPYFYADEQGYFEKNGIKVKLYRYNSQWDVDTAITGQLRAIGVTDMERVAWHRKHGTPLDTLQTFTRRYALVVCHDLRLRRLEGLRLRTVGASRESAADYWCREVMKAAGIKIDDALRPQINDLEVRTTMLNQNQLDAALLPEPYITMARAAGHKVLWSSPESPALTCFAASPKRRNSRQEFAALQRAYRMATDSLKGGGKTAARQLLQDTYGLTPEVIDSLKLAL